MIKVSGENVSLTEVEAGTPRRPGVLECAVLGRPDPVRDMVPVAYVVPRDPEHPPAISDLAEWSERNLAAAARPRDWHLIEALPRTTSARSTSSSFERAAKPGTLPGRRVVSERAPAGLRFASLVQ